MDEQPPRTVFDSEALLALFNDEPGADVTRKALHPVATGAHQGYVHEVNAAEIWYILARNSDAENADDHLSWLRHEARLTFVTSEQTWRRAAIIKARHRMSLADAFAIATAYNTGATVLTGNDHEFDAGAELGVAVRRIRTAERH